MSFLANFYKMEKRENSTMLPNRPVDYSLNITFKGESSITNPTLAVDMGTTNQPSQLNYVYIPEFHRYYWVNNWIWIANRLWQCDCAVDVLATYKNEIGNSTLYVERSASEHDGNVVDNLFPCNANQKSRYVELASPFGWSDDHDIEITDGVFILGTTSYGTTGQTYGSVSYTAMAAPSGVIMNKYLLDIIDSDSTLTDALGSAGKSLIDPMQYIKSDIWVPISIESLQKAGIISSSVENLSYYIYTIDNCANCPMDKYKSVYHTSLQWDYIPRHPQSGDKGSYCNLSPFTEYYISVPPFGIIPLDSLLMKNNSKVYCDMYIDLISGAGILKVYIGETLFTISQAQIGVSIQLSQATTDYLGTTTSAAGALGDIFSLDFAGAANGIANSVKSSYPTSKTTGSNGGYSALYAAPRLNCKFTEICPDNNSEKGRPLMKMRRINSLHGYCIVQEGDVTTAGTSEENRAIKQYLESGFYYE